MAKTEGYGSAKPPNCLRLDGRKFVGMLKSGCTCKTWWLELLSPAEDPANPQNLLDEVLWEIAYGIA